jgi:hypothetical protein
VRVNSRRKDAPRELTQFLRRVSKVAAVSFIGEEAGNVA